MTVNLNLAGLPAVCLPCGFAEQPGGAKLPVGVQVRAGRNVRAATRATPWGTCQRCESRAASAVPVSRPLTPWTRLSHGPLQMIGRAFGEAELLQLAHVFEQTAGVMAEARPAVYAAME